MFANKIKLFFLDLDGTLLDLQTQQGKAISPQNLKALKERRQRGYEACISTGRIGPQALAYLKMSQLDYAITGNGAQIIDANGKILKQLEISAKQIQKIAQFVLKHDLAIKLDNTRIAYNVQSPLSQKIMQKINYQESKIFNFNLQIKRIKLILWGKKPDLLPKFGPLLMQAVPGLSVVSAERGYTLEVTHEDATKAKGNLWAMQHLFHINDPQFCCHIGDTMNDFPVIGQLGYFVAPLNAQKDLLKRAPYLTVAHFQNAVAEVMQGHFWANPFLT